jgi:hypothetical protein
LSFNKLEVKTHSNFPNRELRVGFACDCFIVIAIIWLATAYDVYIKAINCLFLQFEVYYFEIISIPWLTNLK